MWSIFSLFLACFLLLLGRNLNSKHLNSKQDILCNRYLLIRFWLIPHLALYYVLARDADRGCARRRSFSSLVRFRPEWTGIDDVIRLADVSRATSILPWPAEEPVYFDRSLDARRSAGPFSLRSSSTGSNRLWPVFAAAADPETVVPVAIFMRKSVIPFFAVSCLFSTGISTGISTGNFQWFVNHIIVIKSHHRDIITSSW